MNGAPACWPMSWTARMFGWFSAAAARASCSNRASRSGSVEKAAGSTLIATSRPRRASRARYTSPMPPAPSGPRISYAARRVPVGSCIEPRADYIRAASDSERLGAVADLVHRRAHLVEYGEQQVRHRRVRCVADVAVTLQPSRRAADEHDRQRVVVVLVAVAQAAAVQHHRVVEQVAVAVGRRLQPLEEVGEHLHVVAVDDRELIHVLAIVRVM